MPVVIDEVRPPLTFRQAQTLSYQADQQELIARETRRFVLEDQ